MYVVFDVGGTNTRVAWSKDGYGLDAPLLEKTIHDSYKGPLRLLELIEEVAAGRPIHSITGGIAGVLDGERTSLLHAPHLSEWELYPLVGTLSQHFSCPVHIENDAAMVALGEAHYGAGSDYDIVAYLTISTGVGGARIVNGVIDESRHGFEPGHHIMDWNTGETFEELVSGSANEKRYDTNIIDIPTETWGLLAKQVAIGIYNTNLFWSPDCIVLGGSMITKKISIPFHQITTAYRDLPAVFSPGPEIKKATLEAFGGLYGSLARARQLH